VKTGISQALTSPSQAPAGPKARLAPRPASTPRLGTTVTGSFKESRSVAPRETLVREGLKALATVNPIT